METPETPTNTEAPAPQNISSAADFKKKREAREAGDVLTLDSGLTVRLRRPEVTKLIAKGLIPSTMVQRFMNLQGKEQSAVKAEDIEAVLTFQRETAKAALLEPTISDNPNYDEGQIAIDDLDDRDLDEIWAYVNGGLKAVDLFRKRRDSGNVSGLGGKEIPAQTT